MRETFSYLQAGLDKTIKTYISRDMNCLTFQTHAFKTILKWRNILYHSSLMKIVQHNSILTNVKKKKEE